MNGGGGGTTFLSYSVKMCKIFTTASFALSAKKGLFKEKFLIEILKSVRYKEVSDKNCPLYRGVTHETFSLNQGNEVNTAVCAQKL